MSKEKVSGTITAWISSEYRLDGYLNAKTAEDRLDCLTLSKQDLAPQGWILLGEVTVTYTDPDKEYLRAGAADAIRAQIQQEKADSYKRLMGLEDKLNQLLAITCEAQT